ncbi:hypothetical protein IWX90DRAFT_494995 [Phyllosticta citrichinensis]|uniref:Uncharacterized protein n=1 Tax=Phyllosticta citrichinensis TaxID=1130410 RepID=A0ABR1XHV2_9PEZI
MVPRYKGHAGFDFKLMGLDGATKLLNMIAEDPTLFQGIRSLYLGVTVDGLDDYVDDMLAAALNVIGPGNVPHNLEKVKVFITGVDYMEMHAESICSPAASRDAPYHGILFNRDPPESLLQSKGVVYYKAERAFIRALLNIRGVKHVEVEGPMPAELKKRIGACLTTRPGHKVRSWKGGPSAFRSEAEIGWGNWVASMQSRDEDLDHTVGPDGVELADTTALHRGLDVSFHVSFPVPPSPRPEDDRTIWNKPPFRFPSPPSANIEDNAPAPRQRTSATISTAYAEDFQDSHSSPILSDSEDDDFVPDASSPVKPSPVKRRRSTTTRAPVPDRRKRSCIRSPSLPAAALDAYDAKRAIGFPPSPAGKLHRVNYADDLGNADGGGADSSKRMTWFRGNRRVGQRQWVLPTGKAAKVSVARRVEREGRRHMVAARRGMARQEESEGSAEDDDDDLLLSASDSGSSEREDDDEYQADSPDSNGPGTRRPPSTSIDNASEDIPDPQQGSDDTVDGRVAYHEDVDMEDEGDNRDDELFDVD